MAVMVATSRCERHRYPVIAIGISFGVHLGLWLWARGIQQPLPAPVRRAIEFTLDARHVEPPAPPAPIPPQPTPALLPPARVAARSHKPPTNPPPRAEATPIRAQQPEPSGPVDFTRDVFVSGTAQVFAAGVASSNGTGTAAGRKLEVAAPGTRATDASSSVSLQSDAWSCPWPGEADAERIDEQTVVIRVVVDAAGNADSVTVVSDPGHGFGSAAISCAMRTRFTPATDPEGKPVRAKSPPIRVRFTR
jgi:protein TonB